MLKDDEKTTSIEEKIAVVDEWVSVFCETGEIGCVDREILRRVLEHFGAKFPNEDSREDLEALSSLSEFSNAKKGLGMRFVWGEKIVGRRGEYNSWADFWAKNYMKRTGLKLPVLRQKSKFEVDEFGNPVVEEFYNSGMVAWFGEVTAYAAGGMDFGALRKNLEARYYNGKTFQREQQIEGVESLYRKIAMVEVSEKKGERIAETKEIRPSSFPPEFPKAAWEKIKSLGQ